MTGGSGFIGSYTVPAVRARGHDVRLLVRSPDKARAVLAARGVETDEVELVVGPSDCALDPSDALRPLLPGQRAAAPAAAPVDPFALDGGHAVLCGAYAPLSDPRESAPAR